jgi:pilus assembly protein Flp/PilA
VISAVKNLLKDESGATLVEYGLLMLLVAIAAIASMTYLGGKISTVYSNAGNDL